MPEEKPQTSHTIEYPSLYWGDFDISEKGKHLPILVTSGIINKEKKIGSDAPERSIHVKEISPCIANHAARDKTYQGLKPVTGGGKRVFVQEEQEVRNYKKYKLF